MHGNILDKNNFSPNNRYISIYKMDYINHNTYKENKETQRESTTRLSKLPKRFMQFLMDIKLKLEKRKKVYCL
jgi:hypothetical protein